MQFYRDSKERKAPPARGFFHAVPFSQEQREKGMESENGKLLLPVHVWLCFEALGSKSADFFLNPGQNLRNAAMPG